MPKRVKRLTAIAIAVIGLGATALVLGPQQEALADPRCNHGPVHHHFHRTYLIFGHWDRWEWKGHAPLNNRGEYVEKWRNVTHDEDRDLVGCRH